MTIPRNSIFSSLTKGAYFSDTFSLRIRYRNQSALDVYLVIAKETPNWVNFLMFLRNGIVSKLGLKNLGYMADIDFSKRSREYQGGDQVGVFTVHTNTHNEVILEDRDKHLDVKVSLYLESEGEVATVHASTVVHVKNALGKAYMIFVTPFHKAIMPAILKSLPQV